jgi:hypothetical protein
MIGHAATSRLTGSENHMIEASSTGLKPVFQETNTAEN